MYFEKMSQNIQRGIYNNLIFYISLTKKKGDLNFEEQSDIVSLVYLCSDWVIVYWHWNKPSCC